MSETMEDLEDVCDVIANEIDVAEGDLTLKQVDQLIDANISPTQYDRRDFDMMFDNLYSCDVKQYVSNASDDASWSPTVDLEVEEFEDMTLDDAGDLGFAVADESWD